MLIYQRVYIIYTCIQEGKFDQSIDCCCGIRTIRIPELADKWTSLNCTRKHYVSNPFYVKDLYMTTCSCKKFELQLQLLLHTRGNLKFVPAEIMCLSSGSNVAGRRKGSVFLMLMQCFFPHRYWLFVFMFPCLATVHFIFVVQLLKKYCEIIMFSENQPPHLPRQEQSPITESALTSADGQWPFRKILGGFGQTHHELWPSKHLQSTLATHVILCFAVWCFFITCLVAK
jgi:hypothetical protein